MKKLDTKFQCIQSHRVFLNNDYIEYKIGDIKNSRPERYEYWEEIKN